MVYAMKNKNHKFMRFAVHLKVRERRRAEQIVWVGVAIILKCTHVFILLYYSCRDHIRMGFNFDFYL